MRRRLFTYWKMKNEEKFLKQIISILFLSFSIFGFRFLTSIYLLLISGNIIVKLNFPLKVTSILWIVLGSFGQVIVSFIVGILCLIRKKQKLYGLSTICLSFYWEILLAPVESLPPNCLGEILLFILSICAFFIGITFKTIIKRTSFHLRS